MKNYLLLIAAALVATSASAQQPKLMKFSPKDAKAAPASMMMEKSELFKEKPSTLPAIFRAAGTAANPTAFYKRPKGTLFMGYSDDFRGYGATIPMFTPYAPITFVNGSKNPSATTWYLGNEVDKGDASNNYMRRFAGSSAIPVGYNYYIPTLVNGADSFALGDGVNLHASADMGLTINSFVDGAYYGAQGPKSFFGDGSTTYNGQNYDQFAFYQVYDKPEGALSINEISLLTWCNGADFKKTAANLTAYIYNVTDTTVNGTVEHVLGDNLLGTFKFVPDSVKADDDWSTTAGGPGKAGSTAGIATLYPLVDDGLGGQMVQPVDVADQYAVVVTGFRGTNLGFYFTEAPENFYVTSQTTDPSGRASYTFDSNTPVTTRMLYVNSNNRSIDLGYRYPYYASIILHGTQNYAGFDESSTDEKGIVTSFTEFTAAPGGGVAVNDSGYVGQLYTALPWQDADGFDNYTINIDYGNETPWLVGLVQNEDGTYSISQIASSTNIDVTKSFVNTANWENYGIQVVGFSAQALPAGKTGRHAIISINANGYESNKIVVRQGDDNFTAADGIEAITVNGKKATNGRIYNIGGQQVNKAYKGVVIRDGKKFIQ